MKLKYYSLKLIECANVNKLLINLIMKVQDYRHN